MGKMFFNILTTFAEFEADLIRMRTREGMAIARAKGRLRGKQHKEFTKMHASGENSIPRFQSEVRHPALIAVRA